jgi:hypothetical protein
MKSFRHRWVKLLALFGVMLHAHALAGHQGRAMAMAFAQATAPAGHVVICRADGTTETVSFEALFNGERGKQSKAAHCPVCSGAAPPFAIEAPALAVVVHLPRAIETPLLIEQAALPVARAARPPATGPPTLV